MRWILMHMLTAMLFLACHTREAASQRSEVPVNISDTTRYHLYPWLSSYAISNKLINRIPVPEGYERVPVEQGSFESWLRNIPLKDGNPDVLLFDGRKKPNQRAQFAVLNIDTGNKDLQQCADAVMRLRGEYLYSSGRYNDIHFNFTNGFYCDFKKWSQGYRPVVTGNDVSWSRREEPALHYQTFRKYMDRIFTYCGTHSLSCEMKPKDMRMIEAGDVFIQGGFPGHAAIVLDVAGHLSSGERIFLLAQSYMPAQDMHILVNPVEGSLSPWYSSTAAVLVTPEWTFQRTDLKEF